MLTIKNDILVSTALYICKVFYLEEIGVSPRCGGAEGFLKVQALCSSPWEPSWMHRVS